MREELLDPDLWCPLSSLERRELLAAELFERLRGEDGVVGARIEPGPFGNEYDLTAVIETDVGDLRTPLWSHVRSGIFCDSSIHPANRRQLAPGHALGEAAERLRSRLAIRLVLESRGASFTWRLGDEVERVWTAERALFRGRTAVTREDRLGSPGEGDLRDLLALHYTGPALRLVAEDGTPTLLPGAIEEADGRLVSLCTACGRWAEGGARECSECGAPAEPVIAHRPHRR